MGPNSNKGKKGNAPDMNKAPARARFSNWRPPVKPKSSGGDRSNDSKDIRGGGGGGQKGPPAPPQRILSKGGGASSGGVLTVTSASKLPPLPSQFDITTMDKVTTSPEILKKLLHELHALDKLDEEGDSEDDEEDGDQSQKAMQSHYSEEYGHIEEGEDADDKYEASTSSTSSTSMISTSKKQEGQDVVGFSSKSIPLPWTVAISGFSNTGKLHGGYISSDAISCNIDVL